MQPRHQAWLTTLTAAEQICCEADHTLSDAGAIAGLAADITLFLLLVDAIC